MREPSPLIDGFNRAVPSFLHRRVMLVHDQTRPDSLFKLQCFLAIKISFINVESFCGGEEHFDALGLDSAASVYSCPLHRSCGRVKD